MYASGDNFVVLGASRAKVLSLSSAGVAALRAKGLVVHEEETAEGSIKILGWQFEGTVMRPLNHRVWRVILAIEHDLFCESAAAVGSSLKKSSVTLAVLAWVGESPWLSWESYTFVQKHYGHSHTI